MTGSSPDIVALNPGNHGIPIEVLREAVAERLPGYNVATAYTPDQKRQLLSTARFAVGINLESEYIPHATAVELFASTYAGTGHIPLDELASAGIAVTNASGVHGPNIGEYVLGAILLFIRRFDEATRRQRRNEWRHFQADELMGKTVTIIGLGAIGTAIVERLEGFGVRTIGVRYSPEKGGPTDEVIGFDPGPLHEALSRTDVLVLACPLTETTRGLIAHDELVTLPPDALLVNIARGPVIDTDDLVTILQDNQLGGAVLDVTDPEPLPADHPLWGFENVRITPHNAGHTPQYFARVADILTENVIRIERGEAELVNQVV